MNTLLRFFKPHEFTSFKEYEDEDVKIPQINAVVSFEDDDENVYRVKDIEYIYCENSLMLDVTLKYVEQEYLDQFDEDIKNEFDYDSECECCELNDAGMVEDEPEEEKEDKTDYSALLRDAIADLFGELGVKVEFTKE